MTIDSIKGSGGHQESQTSSHRNRNRVRRETRLNQGAIDSSIIAIASPFLKFMPAVRPYHKYSTAVLANRAVLSPPFKQGAEKLMIPVIIVIKKVLQERVNHSTLDALLAVIRQIDLPDTNPPESVVCHLEGISQEALISAAEDSLDGYTASRS